MAWSHDIACDIAALRVRLAATRFFLALVRHELLRLKANFDPNQPRVPRGQHEGGRWTRIGGGPFAGSEAAPGIDWQPVGSIGKPSARPVAKPRAEGLDGNVILAQARGGPPQPFRMVQTSRGMMPASPAEEVVYEAARGEAEAIVRFVRQSDPSSRPRETSLFETVRGATRTQYAITREAEAYLNSIRREFLEDRPPRNRTPGIGEDQGLALDPREPPIRTPLDVLAPGGRIIGYRAGRASSHIRTLSKNEFEAVLARITRMRFFSTSSKWLPRIIL
ncbi:hypothetical protein GCM10011390_10070 [Aureimonas endophytica]|uniref:Uncharacterized protein n=1 Tax=Aureimonas endophytica TaxID=2027858 RepID=A0A916ZFR7_9HYPH|nr:hypothetical protein [Aureimonas endophytica]GGD93277.1 hypothetical protein GCM10011390_10070 [Aureimonas endophytica]